MSTISSDAVKRIRRTLSLLLVAVCLAALQGCASLSPVDKAPSAAIAASTGTGLGGMAAQSLSAGESAGFRALPASALAMDARLALTGRAERTLDLQYYLLKDDGTGRTWMRAVRDAAGRGVRVRLLVDDLYTTGSARLLHELAAHDNVEVRVFNPFPGGRSLTLTRWGFSLLDFARVNHRMHNKLFIADGAFAIAGGRNVADEYFFRSETGNFVDFDLLLAGAPVDQLAAIFDTYWNSLHAYPLHALEGSRGDPLQLRSDFEHRTASAAAAFPPLPPDTRDTLGHAPLSVDLAHPPVRLLHGAVRVFADDPQKVTGRSERGDDPDTVTAAAIRACDEATAELTLASPYVVPGRIGMDALRRVRARGVRTSLITNSLASNDEPFASAAYARYRKALLRMGVSIHEMSARPPAIAQRHGVQIAAVGRSHAKIAVIDAHTTFVGSMNMDLRSSRQNTELGVLVESAALAAQVSGLLDELRRNDTYRLQLVQPGDHITWTETVDGVTVVHADEPDVSPGRQLKLFLFSPFVPEGLL